MCYGYWKKNIHLNESNFSVFFRKNPFNSGYAVCCGLEFIIDYLNNLKFTDSDIDYLQSLKSDDGKNLFDKEYSEVHGYPALGRAFHAELNYSF